jgi:hypothetical protein
MRPLGRNYRNKRVLNQHRLTILSNEIDKWQSMNSFLLHRTTWSDLPSEVNLFPAEAALLEPLDLEVSENPFQDLRTLFVLAGGEDSHLGFVFSECSHRLCNT